MKPENEFVTPNTWASSLNKLSGEALGFRTHVANITDKVGECLEMGRIAAPSNTIFAMTNQLSALGSKVSSVSTHVEDLRAIVSSPSSLLVDDSKSAFLSAGTVVDSIGSTLSSAASMAATFRSAAEQLCITDHGQIEGLRTNSLTVLEASEPSISVESLSQDTIGILDNRLETNISAFNNLIDTSMVTLRLNAEIYAKPIDMNVPYLTDASRSLTELNMLTGSIYDDLRTFPSLDTNSFLLQALTVEPYAATRATAVVAGLDEQILDQLAVPDTDELLDELGGELEARLYALNSELADVYREGIAAIESGHHGWIRHAGVSFRTMFDHLLRQLAPNSDLHSFLDDPESNMIDGEFKRNARLRYIFREISRGAYAKMAEQDIKLAEATFFPSNDIVHKLSSLSEKQMRVFWRRIQGCVSVVLEAAGH